MVSVGLDQLYLLELLFVKGLRQLLSFIELLDPLFAERLALGQQVVQALEAHVLGLLALTDVPQRLSYLGQCVAGRVFGLA